MGKFSNIQVVIHVRYRVRMYFSICFFRKDSANVNMDLNPTLWRKQKNRIIQIGEFIVI